MNQHASTSIALAGASAIVACFCALAACGAAPSAPAGAPDVADAGGFADTDAAAAAPVADPTGFRASGRLREARAMATATRLRDGRVLVAGGERADYGLLATAEIYDPATDSVSPAPPMPEARAHHTATRLPNGEILIVGGGRGSVISIPSGDGVLASAVLYDPASNTWKRTGKLNDPRAGHRAVALPDGRVLVAGGGDRVGYPCAQVYGDECTVATSIGTVEIYDPATGTFSRAADLAQPRIAFTLDILPSGVVVAAGGAAKNEGLASVETFDPKTARWSEAASLDGQRLYHASGVLGSSVVVIGGKIANVGPLTSTAVLDDVGKDWREGASVDVPRTGAKLVTLTSGRGLLVGGSNQLKNATLADARIYDASTDHWTPIGPLAHARYSHVAVMLDDGSVAVFGGRNERGSVRDIERTKN